MNKVLLLSCFISLTAHAGTGGGISTPPGRAGLAKLLAESLGLNSLFLMRGAEPLPQEIVVQAEAATAPAVDPVTVVVIGNEAGESRSYRVTDGEVVHQFILKDRRQTIRASMLQKP